MNTLHSWIAAVVLLAACEGGGVTDAGSVGPDAGPSVDAGSVADAAVDAGSVADAAVDAGSLVDASGGAVFAGCEGSGPCASFDQMGCSVGHALGCELTYSEYCSLRGCTTFDMSACGTSDMGCIWNEDLERCEDDPECPAQPTQEACMARGCAWIRVVSGCTGSYDCAALDDVIMGADGGVPESPCEMINGFGPSCVTRYE